MTPIARALDAAAVRYRGPIQLYDRERIRGNLDRVGRALGNHGRVLFAVKSFPAPEVITLAAEIGVGFEVSSPLEYDLLPDDLRDTTVSLNAPAPLGLERYVERGNRLDIHLDDADLATGLVVPRNARLTLRLSHTAMGIPDVASPEVSVSRFGASLEAFIDGAPLFQRGVLSGIHVHNGSEANTAAFYRAALGVILSTAHAHAIPLGSINLGGGLHSVDDAELEALLGELAHMAGDIPLHVEPGRLICQGAGFLLSRVLAIRQMEPGRFNITLDSSYECHAKWARLTWIRAGELGAERRDYREMPAVERGQLVLHFTGSSCSERDVLAIYRIPGQTRPPVEVGDVLTFGDLHGYAYAWSTSFNGIATAETRFV